MDSVIKKEQEKYDSNVIILFKKINDAETLEDKVKLFEEFTKKFTTIPKIWIEWARIINENQSVEVQKKNTKILRIKAMSHFYSKVYDNDIFQRSKSLEEDLIWSKFFSRQVEWGRKESITSLLYYLQFIKKSMTLPNEKLQQYLEYFREFSTKPLDHEIYEKSRKTRKLFDEIRQYHAYQKEWMMNMKKIGDDKFIIQNLEYQLTKNFADKRFWFAYIEFLKEKSYWKWLLNVYSRFCRFFIDDLEMRREYRSEVERIETLDCDVKKWKIDLIKIERDFGSSESALNLMKEYFGKDLKDKEELEVELKLKESEEDKDPCIPDYAIDETGFSPFRTTKSVEFKLTMFQNFAFPPNLIYSILTKSDPHQLHKLHSSSKQLYLITKIPVCHRLEINDFEATVSFEQSLFISASDIQIGNAKKLYLTNSFIIGPKIKKRNFLAEFIPKIYKCTVKFLELFYQDISLEDFDFLVENVEKLGFRYSEVKSNGLNISAVDVIERMPKVTNINFATNGAVAFDTPTLNLFNKKEKTSKISYLSISTIPEVEDPLNICSFIWKHAAPNSRIHIEIQTSQKYIDRLEDLMKIEFRNWIPAKQKPTVIVNYI